MINFIEDQNEGYASRTKVNASADVTFAFATDFDTAGEKLTKKSVKEQNKVYIPVREILHTGWASITDAAFRDACKIKEQAFKKEITVNIAGNGIYTVRGALMQKEFDTFVERYLGYLIDYLKKFDITIISIRSGGQTGADEAGLKAGVKLGFETICLAPKGWKFRNKFGQDISDEVLFKQRFINE